MNWRKGGTDHVIADETGRLDVLVPRFAAEGGAEHASFDGERWKVNPVRFSGMVAYGTIARIGETVLLGIIAADSEGGAADRNSVFFLRSDDGGAKWKPSQLLSRSGAHPAHEIKLRVGADGLLHLLWIQTLPAGKRVLRHVTSRDRGENWSHPLDLEPPEGFSSPQVAIDDCGRLHVVYEDAARRPEGGHLDHAVWAGAWSQPKHMFQSFRSTDPSLERLSDGRVLTVFLAQSTDEPLTALPQSLYSELRPE